MTACAVLYSRYLLLVLFIIAASGIEDDERLLACVLTLAVDAKRAMP
jgi:hypothetical protein